MKGLELNKIPFTQLRIAYFRVFDKNFEKPFLDCTDLQILNLLAKEFHDTVVINRIEDIEVLEVITTIPDKRKLNDDERKNGLTTDEFNKRAEKLANLKQKYE
jgi:hypothetical protein